MQLTPKSLSTCTSFSQRPIPKSQRCNALVWIGVNSTCPVTKSSAYPSGIVTPPRLKLNFSPRLLSRLTLFNSISKSVVFATPICQNHLSNLPATILIILQLFSCKSWQICLLATILSSYSWAHCTLSRDIYLSTASSWL